MAILNIFKRNKPKNKEIKPKREKEKKEKKEVKIEESPKVPVPKAREKKSTFAWTILKTPHVSEKSATLSERNQYVFKVFPKANKTKTKKVIEDLYGVDVVSVKIISVPAKKRRLGKIKGWKEGYKKAVVKIKEGQKIEIMPK